MFILAHSYKIYTSRLHNVTRDPYQKTNVKARLKQKIKVEGRDVEEVEHRSHPMFALTPTPVICSFKCTGNVGKFQGNELHEVEKLTKSSLIANVQILYSNGACSIRENYAFTYD